MASFCNQCAVDLGFLPGDYANGCEPGYICMALCEDCGSCWVDHTGKCVTSNCDKSHWDVERASTANYPYMTATGEI